LHIFFILNKGISTSQLGFYSSFEEQLGHRHPLYILAGKINWQLFEDSFSPLYNSHAGRSGKPIRHMFSLLILKHVRNLSDAFVFRNEYDGRTLVPLLEQTSLLTGQPPQTATVDRGYKGKSKIGETIVQIPKPFNDKTTSKYQQKKLKKSFGQRAAIEPTISHMKQDYRLGRNFYKGITGDNINVMLSAPPSTLKG
jgi:hypothetical protein